MARCPACQALNLIQPGDSNIEQPPSIKNVGESFQFFEPVKETNPPSRTTYSPMEATSFQSMPGYLAPHRGGMILTLGLVSLFCNVLLVPGILAWVWGRSDLRQMKSGFMDRTGESLTMVGMIIGMVMTLLPLAAIVWVIILIFMVFVSAAAHM
jgi:hypothetical protein